MTAPQHEISVPVEGGHLHVACYGPLPSERAAATPGGVLLAVHGITGTGRSWGAVAEHLTPELTVLAPDLRGRGGSRDLPGPSSIARHAEDLLAVLDHLDLTVPVVVAGHSMGAYVTLVLADRAPERVAHAVLVDGGPVLALPPGVDVDELLFTVIGPAMTRLSMTFEDVAAYLDWWRVHPALAACWGRVVEEALTYDLVGSPGQMRSSASIDAVRSDAASTLVPGAIPLDVGPPTSFLRAERGMIDEPGGLFPLEVYGPLLEAAGIPVTTIADTNHYSILWADLAAEDVAVHLRKAVTG